jgi:hypothetical protein
MKAGEYKHTKESIQKMRLAKLSKKQSPETIAKRVLKLIGRKNTPESIDKMRMIALEDKRTPQKYFSWKGKKHSIETKLKISKNRSGISSYWKSKKNPHMVGDKNVNWKGGITPINKKVRHSLEYKVWRTKIFERDDYTCVWCGSKGVELNADHIKSFALFPELRFEISNGRTLCVECHKLTDNYKRKALSTIALASLK